MGLLSIPATCVVWFCVHSSTGIYMSLVQGVSAGSDLRAKLGGKTPRSSSEPLEASRGHLVVFDYEVNPGKKDFVTREVVLADRTDPLATPPRYGPETPLYKALVGKAEGESSTVCERPHNIKVLAILTPQ